MQIIILGMHRSGTSAVGHLLEVLGFEFGSKSLAMKPKADNPKGFWEREDVVGLNDYALAQQEAQWLAPGRWNPEELPETFIHEFDRRAAEIVAGFPAERPWFIKDPRMCITLPLWEKHLSNPVYLIVYRNPVEISLSLWSRDRLPQKAGIALWERYTGEAVNYTRGKKRILLRYSELVSAPKSALLHLATSLKQFGVELPCDVESASARLDIDPKLRHHQGDSLISNVKLTESQDALNRAFCDGTILEETRLVDASGANRQMIAYQAAIEAGELLIDQDGGPLLESEEKPSDEAAAITDNSQERLSNSGNPLKFYRAALAGSVSETTAVLEEAYLFGQHLERVCKSNCGSQSEVLRLGGVIAGTDRAVKILSDFCTELSSWNPLRSSYRKAKRRFVPYKANPKKMLAQLVVSPELATGKMPSALRACGDLLGDILLGKIPVLPDEALCDQFEPAPDQTDGGGCRQPQVSATLGHYQEGLRQTIGRVKTVVEGIQLFARQLERSAGTQNDLGSKSEELKSRREVLRREQIITKLLDLGDRLSSGNPFGSAYRLARREFKDLKNATRAEKPSGATNDQKFRSMIPTVRASERMLEKFLLELNRASAGVEKLCSQAPASPVSLQS